MGIGDDEVLMKSGVYTDSKAALALWRKLMKAPFIEVDIVLDRKRKSKGFDNLDILRKNQMHGLNRKPVYANAKERKQITRFWTTAIKKFNRSGNKSFIQQASSKIGEAFLVLIKNHIYAEKSQRGKFKPLTSKYAASKKRKFGNLPILVRTGELLRSFAFKVRMK